MKWRDFCSRILAQYIREQLVRMGAPNEWLGVEQSIADKFYHRCLDDGQPNQIKTRKVIREVCGLEDRSNFPKPKKQRKTNKK
jgi:hypothetical protein